MPQFFLIEGKSMTTEQVRKWRAQKNKVKEIFCPYCVSLKIRHLKECPTTLPDFDPETAHILTSEEREELIAQRIK